jgi:hypothetical protein
MLNWRLSPPSLRRCRSEKSDRVPIEESLPNAYPGEPPKPRQSHYRLGRASFTASGSPMSLSLPAFVEMRPGMARRHSSRRSRRSGKDASVPSSSLVIRWTLSYPRLKPLDVISRQFVERQNPWTKPTNYKVKLTPHPPGGYHSGTKLSR